MKTFYADYVNHILRFYTRHLKREKFRSEADELNYIAAERAFSKFSETERSILIEVYSRNDTLADNIYDVAKANGINQDEIWTLVRKISNRIAKERKLI